MTTKEQIREAKKAKAAESKAEKFVEMKVPDRGIDDETKKPHQRPVVLVRKQDAKAMEKKGFEAVSATPVAYSKQPD